MRKYLLLFLTFISVCNVYSQTISPDAIVSSGDYYTLPDISISMTLGECITETYKTENNILTQGFQQPFNKPLMLDIKVILEGPYTGSLMSPLLNMLSLLPLAQPYSIPPWNYDGNENVSQIPGANVVDWVLVELRETNGDASTAVSDSVIAHKACFVLMDGTIVGTDGSSWLRFDIKVKNNLFVVVYHRNHLPVMSANPLPLNENVYEYDFTINAFQAYGGIIAQKDLGDGVFGMIGGYALTDGQINNSDKNEIWLPEYNNSGYLPGDFNMDGYVNITDKENIWKLNAGRAQKLP